MDLRDLEQAIKTHVESQTGLGVRLEDAAATVLFQIEEETATGRAVLVFPSSDGAERRNRRDFEHPVTMAVIFTATLSSRAGSTIEAERAQLVALRRALRGVDFDLAGWRALWTRDNLEPALDRDMLTKYRRVWSVLSVTYRGVGQ